MEVASEPLESEPLPSLSADVELEDVLAPEPPVELEPDPPLEFAPDPPLELVPEPPLEPEPPLVLVPDWPVVAVELVFWPVVPVPPVVSGLLLPFDAEEDVAELSLVSPLVEPSGPFLADSPQATHTAKHAGKYKAERKNGFAD